MSGLIDIWMVERDRMPRASGVQAFRSMAWLGASERSEYDGSGGAAKQPSDGKTPEGAVAVAVREVGCGERARGRPRRSFLVHLVDCFRQ
jgi:hypothetical protein